MGLEPPRYIARARGGRRNDDLLRRLLDADALDLAPSGLATETDATWTFWTENACLSEN